MSINSSFSSNATDTDTRVKIAPIFRLHIRPKPDSPDLMQTLPPELRNRIYELALPDLPYLKLGEEEPPLLRTSMQIRSESAPIYYGSCSVWLQGRSDMQGFRDAVKPITNIVRECGKRPFVHFQISMGGAIWTNLDKLLPLLEVMRATGFEPTKKVYEPGQRQSYRDYRGLQKTRLPLGKNSIFCLSNSVYGVVEQVLEKAVALGRQARDEEWTKEQLEKAFEGFVARRGDDPKPSKSKRSKR